MEKELSYEEFLALAMKNYWHGGDVVVECWGKNDFREYCREYGSMTEEKAFSLFRTYDAVCWGKYS